MTKSEQSLIDAIAAGNMESFEKVYRDHKDGLLTLTMVTLKMDRMAAEDVLHDVFMRLAERASSIRLTRSLRNYLAACCLNRARDHLRIEKYDNVPVRGLTPSHDSSGSSIEAIEVGAQIHQLLCRLPEEQRDVITLHIYGDLTFQEVGETLEISINTAKSRYRYGLSKLQHWWPSDCVRTGDRNAD